MHDQPVLDVAHLRISLPGTTKQPPALADLSISLAKGRTLAIVGESDSGKSLAALALIGLLPPAAEWSGTIALSSSHGQFTMRPGPAPELWRRIRGAAVSMVFREPMSTLNPVMKVGRQLAEAIAAHSRIGRREAMEQAISWMGKVQLQDPHVMYHRYPHQLSGGERHRVMIAIAMSSRPAVLIADEPGAGLDMMGRREILILMRQLQQEYATAMIVLSQDPALAAGLADDVLMLRSGHVMEYGPAAAVLGTPQHPYTQALLACRPGPSSRGKRLPEIIDSPAEGVVPVQQPIPPLNAADNVLLKVRHLRVWFPRKMNLIGTPVRFLRAVEDVSFDLLRGEVLGLIGESGCGKSTIGRALAGLQPVESGQMIFNNQDLAHLSAVGWRAVRREVQMIFPDPFSSLNPGQTVGEIIREPLTVHRIVPKKEIEAEARRLMALVQLPEDALRRYPRQFSGGQRQRISIARALALRPKLIVCDESISALDASDQAQILNLLKRLQAELRVSCLFISHDLSAVQYIADNVLVMQAGRIVERGTAEEVMTRPRHPFTQKLVATLS